MTWESSAEFPGVRLARKETLAGGRVLPQTHQYSLQSSVQQKTCLVPLAHGISPDKLCGLFRIVLMGGSFVLCGYWPGSALLVGEAAAAQLVTQLRTCLCMLRFRGSLDCVLSFCC